MSMLPIYPHNRSPLPAGSRQSGQATQIANERPLSNTKEKLRLDFKEGNRPKAQFLGGVKPLHHKWEARALCTKTCAESQGL